MTQANRPTKPVVGVVGGIGSGKSLVARFLAELGAAVIDADLFGHEALAQPDVRRRVVDRWGEAILDAKGEVDRRRLAQIVFADEGERHALESMVFPYIERRIREKLTAAERDPSVPLVVLDAAILLETGWGRVCDTVVFVDAPDAKRFERLQRQRGWTRKEVEERERAQLSLEEKAKRADVVIDNSGPVELTRRQVHDLFRRLVRKASPSSSKKTLTPPSLGESGKRHNDDS